MMAPKNDMEASKLEIKDQFEALFNFATIGIVVTNRQGVIIDFNKFAESQFEYTKAEVVGQPIEILLPQSVHARHKGYRDHYYKHPEPRSMGHGRDLFARTKAGNTFPVEVSLSHYTLLGELYVIAFVIDITVRKHQEEILRNQKEELEIITTEVKLMNNELEKKVDDRTKMLREALVELEKSKEELSEAFENEKELSELKSRFVTMASHEFRTPLSTILSSTYLLEKYNEANPNEKFVKHLHRIKGAVGGMKSILEDFLSLGRLEEGLVQKQVEILSPDDLQLEINNLLNELDPLLKDGQTIDFQFSVPEPIEIDRNLLKNILINLVSNAIKFSLANTTIDIDVSLRANELVISVSDKGIGISEDDQQHLFERFFRAKNASNIQGTGLGLHIVGKYLELLQGRIEMKSEIDEGSTFTVFIPQQNANKR